MPLSDPTNGINQSNLSFYSNLCLCLCTCWYMSVILDTFEVLWTSTLVFFKLMKCFSFLFLFVIPQLVFLTYIFNDIVVSAVLTNEKDLAGLLSIRKTYIRLWVFKLKGIVQSQCSLFLDYLFISRLQCYSALAGVWIFLFCVVTLNLHRYI